MPYTPELIHTLLNVGDEYELGKLTFTPDVIYDIGADMGSISLFAHKLYPKTKIVSVEPNPESYELLVEYSKDIPQIVPVHAGIASGPLYAPPNAEPLHYMAVSKAAPTWRDDLVLSSTPHVMLSDLYAQHGGENFVVKCDCEGAEVDMLRDAASTEVVKKSRYFTAEFHIWGTTHNLMLEAANTMLMWLFWLAQTHTIRMYWYGCCIHVWAVKRNTNNDVE